MKFRLVAVPITVLVLTTLCVPATAVAPVEVKRHDVDLVWKPDAQDLPKGQPIILDTFDSFGSPFGRGAAVETRTPRSQIGTDTRSGKWSVAVNRPAPGSDQPGQCEGRFQLDRDVVETTATSQTVKFTGTLRLTGCTRSRKFRNAQPGKFGELRGKSFCTASGCTGALKITGRMRY